jgi:hypothetical protein
MSVTPDFVGQTYRDTNTGNIWKANSIAAGDWSIQLQNAKKRWTSTQQSLMIPFCTYSNAETFVGIDEVIIQDSILPWIMISSPEVTLETLSCPNLTSTTYITPFFRGIQLEGRVTLTSLQFPLLSICEGPIKISSGTALPSLSFPSLVSIPNSQALVNESFNISDCDVLTAFSFPLFVPVNGVDITISGCPLLSAASVNHILARHVANAGYVSGTIDLSGAAPTGQGIIDAGILTGRGVTVFTN